MAVLTIEVSSLVFAWLRFCSFLDRPCLPFLFFLFAFLDSMLEGLESGDDSRLRLELVRGLLFSSSFSAISLNVAKRMGENSYLYSKAAKSYFDEPREKLSSRPLCGRDKTISRSSKDFVAKVYTTFCVQPENL
jgi:hypothetical protein